ncbi:MAG TPA: universal stress protein [Kofleriaceae bacterium]|nr:universal stress protein [Kofleriaceae bacterium]
MNTLQSILVPVDGSSASLSALDHAVTLARDYGARVEVFHIMPVEDSLTEEARAEVQKAMDSAVQRAKRELGDRLAMIQHTGDPLVEIVRQAQQDHVDLIVMGTHGRIGRLHELLGGSVAEGVVRNAPCPVLTVRDKTGGYQSFADSRRYDRPPLAEQGAASDQPRSR